MRPDAKSAISPRRSSRSSAQSCASSSRTATNTLGCPARTAANPAGSVMRSWQAMPFCAMRNTRAPISEQPLGEPPGVASACNTLSTSRAGEPNYLTSSPGGSHWSYPVTVVAILSKDDDHSCVATTIVWSIITGAAILGFAALVELKSDRHCAWRDSCGRIDFPCHPRPTFHP
jgi:hypothetical protein